MFLKVLLGKCYEVTESGWCALFSLLKWLFESLESLTMNLGITYQSDKSVTALANSISQLKTLNTLNLNYGNDDKPLRIFGFLLF